MNFAEHPVILYSPGFSPSMIETPMFCSMPFVDNTSCPLESPFTYAVPVPNALRMSDL